MSLRSLGEDSRCDACIDGGVLGTLQPPDSRPTVRLPPPARMEGPGDEHESEDEMAEDSDGMSANDSMAVCQHSSVGREASHHIPRRHPPPRVTVTATVMLVTGWHAMAVSWVGMAVSEW